MVRAGDSFRLVGGKKLLKESTGASVIKANFQNLIGFFLYVLLQKVSFDVICNLFRFIALINAQLAAIVAAEER
jgi:hypothetical protein